MSRLFKLSFSVSGGHIRLLSHFIRHISFQKIKNSGRSVTFRCLLSLVSSSIRQTVFRKQLTVLDTTKHAHAAHAHRHHHAVHGKLFHECLLSFLRFDGSSPCWRCHISTCYRFCQDPVIDFHYMTKRIYGLLTTFVRFDKLISYLAAGILEKTAWSC